MILLEAKLSLHVFIMSEMKINEHHESTALSTPCRCLYFPSRAAVSAINI